MRLAHLGDSKEGSIFRCRNCGSLKILDTAIVPPMSAPYGEAYREALDDQKLPRLLELFAAATGDREVGRILDVGCADGAFLQAVGRLGWKATGIDPDPNAVQKARAAGLAVIRACADESAPLHDRFDAITMWDLIEHVPDPARSVAWLVDRVASDGLIIVVTPDAGSLLDLIAHIEWRGSFRTSSRLIDICLNRYHLHRFTQSGLTALFERHGFETLRCDPIRLFSLRPEKYLSGFAPGLEGWTGFAGFDRLISRVAYHLLEILSMVLLYLLHLLYVNIQNELKKL